MSNFMGAYPDVDKTLTQEGVAADAKAVGDELSIRTIKYFGSVGDYNESNSITYDMSGKPKGLYMACFFRSNRIYLLYMRNDNTLEWIADSQKNIITTTGSTVTFKNLCWYDKGYLFKLC